MLGPVPFTVCFILGVICTATGIAELTALNKFAKENNLPGISNNMFKSGSDVQRIRQAIPAGELRIRIKWLKAVGLICWIPVAVLTGLAYIKR
jgi:hypothetical protein